MYRNIYFTIYFICWFFNLLHAACLYNKETQNVPRGKEPFNFRIYDHNIRATGATLEPSERPWSERKDDVIAAMLANCLKVPTIITVQDALLSQVNDIVTGLNENKGTSWTYFGYGADNGSDGGKFNPIFYDSNQWSLRGGHHRWISMTPGLPSCYPLPCSKTTILMAVLFHKTTGSIINIFNTQFDHKSLRSREFGSRYLLELAKMWMDGWTPTVVTGDIHSTKENYPEELITELFDDCSKEFLSAYSTFSGFAGPDGETTDFVFADKGHFRVSNYEIIDNKSKDGTYRFSNHRPVVVDFSI